MTKNPPFIERIVDLNALMAKKSHFLLGPRQTGKTFLIDRTFSDAKIYDLLDTATYLELSRNAGLMAQELRPRDQIVIIDEIQRLPELLNEVHRLIESHGLRFLLIGSSARKLRRGGINLLGGRARTQHLHPLTCMELARHFDLARAIERGLIPSIYFSGEPRDDLKAYTGSYLQQEIAAEGATRNIPAFSRFLRVAAFCNATIVNFTQVANDAQVARTTVYEYFEILKDTLILYELPAWRKSIKRKPLASSKYFFFDVGVVSSLQEREYKPETPEYGEAFETYLMHELHCYCSYRSGETLSYWKSTSGFEVDFILGDHTAIEIKAKKHLLPKDIKSLQKLAQEDKMKRYICVGLLPRRRTVEGIEILPYKEFLNELWGGAYGQ